MKLVTSFETLMRLAKKLNYIKANGDEEDIKRAKLEFETYKKLCLESDEMMVNGLKRS